MRATVMYGAGDVRVETVPDARLIEPTDALVVVTRAAICGSDLWPYKSMEHSETGRRMGHEFIGVVEAVGDRRPHRQGRRRRRRAVPVVRRHLRLLPGRAAHLVPPRRQVRAATDVDGGQGEAVRVPQADGTLVVLPVGADDALMPSLLTLSDVMGTGHHAALAARVGPGKTVAVVGDGAVGLCGVIAARRLGAEQIVLLGRHPDRIALAREFGATDIVSERGDEAVERVRELTGGFGAHSVLECVGHEQSTITALDIVRPGGAVGRVGVPQEESIPDVAADLLRQRHDQRRPGAGPRLHRGAAAGRPRGQDRARPRLRPGHEPRRGARRLPRDERPRGDQGHDRAMSTWAGDDLERIGAAEELELASVRDDGTLRDPVTMWVVRHGDDLYVRSVKGRGSSWFRGAQIHHEARIRAGGVDRDALLVETDDVNDELDVAYRAKYRRYAAGIVDSIVSPEARAATLRLMPST